MNHFLYNSGLMYGLYSRAGYEGTHMIYIIQKKKEIFVKKFYQCRACQDFVVLYVILMDNAASPAELLSKFVNYWVMNGLCDLSVNITEFMSNLQLSLPVQASVLIGLTYSSTLLYICSFCIHKISHTGLTVQIGTFFISICCPMNMQYKIIILQ